MDCTKKWGRLLLEVGSEMTENLVFDAGRRLDVLTTSQCLDGLALFLGERFWHIDRDVDDFITTLTTITVDVRDTFVLQS